MRWYTFLVILLNGTVLLTDLRAVEADESQVPRAVGYDLTSDLEAVFFVDLLTGWAVSEDGHIIMTEDGGLNWQLQYQHEEHLKDVHFVSSTTGWATGDNGSVLRTVDGGQSWQAQGDFSIKFDIKSVFFRDGSLGWVAGTDWSIMGGKVAKTEDGGVTWDTVGIYDAHSLKDVHFVDEQHGWAVGEEEDDEGVILGSSDGGASWVVQKSNVRNIHGAVGFQTVFFPSQSTGWAMGYGGIILKTSDSGANWTVQTSDNHNAFRSSFFINDLTGWAVGDWGRIYFTDDGGETWVRQESGLDTDRITSGLVSVFFVDDTTGWAVGHVGNIIHTEDGGQEWVVQQTVPLPSVDLYVSPSGDNDNSGLSPDDPLRTLGWAAWSINADSLNPRTIYLAAGRYSPSTNGESFPIRSTTNTELSYVTIKGPPGGGAILDAEGDERLLVILNEESVVLENLVLTGGFDGYAGGAIYCWESDVTLSQVTISRNTATDGGGAIYCGGCNLMIDHAIMFYNSPEAIYIPPPDWPSPSTVTVSYSDIEGGADSIKTNDNGTVHWNEGNMEAAPLFCDPEGRDFSLGGDSPCAGAGDGGTDIGALGVGCDAGYVAVKTGEDVPRSFGLFQNYPNPFNAGTVIKIDVAEAGPVRLMVYDLLGREVARLVDGLLEAGCHELAWDGGELPSGIYIARLVAPGFSTSIKMVMLK
ncbi:MAG: T9SS type A sorting domain-containing protein [Fidelibacterota bacterium]|nr:MAG: T9SS type A sorting domain-containing protein [Candidatus Neomarinimicrobiota bacterium]